MSKIKIFSFKIADFLFVFLFVVTIIYFSANIFLNKKAKTKQLIIESGKNIWCIRYTISGDALDHR